MVFQWVMIVLQQSLLSISYKTSQILLQNAVAFLLRNMSTLFQNTAAFSYYKTRRFYYNTAVGFIKQSRRVLQNASIITKWGLITSLYCDVYKYQKILFEFLALVSWKLTKNCGYFPFAVFPQFISFKVTNKKQEDVFYHHFSCQFTFRINSLIIWSLHSLVKLIFWTRNIRWI